MPTQQTNTTTKPAAERKTVTIGGFWRRESQINPGQKYLAGRLNLLIGDTISDLPPLKITAYPVDTKKTEKSFDVKICANKEELGQFVHSLQKHFVDGRVTSEPTKVVDQTETAGADVVEQLL